MNRWFAGNSILGWIGLPFAFILVLLSFFLDRPTLLQNVPAEMFPTFFVIADYWLQVMLSGVGLLIGTFLVYSIASNHQIHPRGTSLTAVFYVLFYGAFAYRFASINLLFAQVFLMLAIYRLLSFRKGSLISALFDSGFFLGIASLLLPQYSLFLLVLIYYLKLTKAIQLRDVLIPVVGWIAPWYLYGMLLFLKDGVLFWQNLELSFSYDFSLPRMDSLHLILFSFTGVLAGIGLIGLIRSIQREKVIIQHARKLILAVLSISVFLVFIELKPETMLQSWYVLAIPFALIAPFGLFMRVSKPMQFLLMGWVFLVIAVLATQLIQA
jgi:hypothetical protein